jgi:tryptophan-rich sensory protein
MNKTAKLIIAILIPLVVGFTSGLFNQTGEGSWFQALQKPSWNPPSWVFAPVWTTLYIMMGIALYLIWKTPSSSKRKIAIVFFTFQLVLNFFWSFIFFKLEQPGWAFAEIVVLWLAILATIFSFASINKAAAWLLVPYISWVSFAAMLNYSIWTLNS